MFFLSKSRLITVDFFPNRIKVSKVNRPLSGYKPIKESSCVVFDHLNLACAWNQVENETDRVKNGKRCAFDGLLIFLMSHGYWLYIQFSNPRKKYPSSEVHGRTKASDMLHSAPKMEEKKTFSFTAKNSSLMDGCIYIFAVANFIGCNQAGSSSSRTTAISRSIGKRISKTL